MAASPHAAGRAPRWLRRIAWLLLIWAASVAALGLVALVLRLLMSWAGMTR